MLVIYLYKTLKTIYCNIFMFHSYYFYLFFQKKVDPRVALTGDQKLIQSSGIQTLGGKLLKNQATVIVREDIVIWESSHDKCTFFRTQPSLVPCTKCSSNTNTVKIEDISRNISKNNNITNSNITSNASATYPAKRSMCTLGVFFLYFWKILQIFIDMGLMILAYIVRTFF